MNPSTADRLRLGKEIIKMLKRHSLLQKLKTDRRGVTALEYGLIASLIAVAIIVAVTNLGTTLANTFNTISNRIGTATG